MLIAGMDISYSGVDAVGCIAIVSYPDLTLVKHLIIHSSNESINYIPNHLALKELEINTKLLTKCKLEHPDIYSNIRLLMIDGNGQLHPEKYGLACHVGSFAQIPTIGVAKNMMHIHNEQLSVASYNDFPFTLPGDYKLLEGVSGYIYGAAVRTTIDSFKPIFVSIGHSISLQDSIHFVLNSCKYRVPEPIRLADFYSRKYIRDINLY